MNLVTPSTKTTAHVRVDYTGHEFTQSYGDPKRVFQSSKVDISWDLVEGVWELRGATVHGALVLKSGGLSESVTGDIRYGDWERYATPADIQAIIDAHAALLPTVTLDWPKG